MREHLARTVVERRKAGIPIARDAPRPGADLLGRLPALRPPRIEGRKGRAPPRRPEQGRLACSLRRLPSRCDLCSLHPRALEQHQSQSVHHAARDRRHLRRRHLDPLDRHRGRHGRSLERGGNAFDAAVATAFTLQVVEPHLNGPGGDVPVIVHDVRKGKVEVICGQGPAPGRRHHRALPRPRPRSRPRHRPAGRLRARHVRDLDAAAARLRHHEARRRARARDLLRAQRPSAGRARQRHHRHGRGTVPRALADLGGGLSARRQGARRPARCSPTRRWPRPTRASCARPRAPAATARSRSSTRARSGRTASSPRRSTASAARRTSWTPAASAIAACSPATTWRAGRPRVEAPVTYDYGRYTVCKAGFWSQGPVMLQQLALLKGFDLDGADPTSADFIHTVVECSKLALCRPRNVLRRSKIRGGAGRCAAVGRLQRRAAQARRRGGLAGAAARQHSGLRRVGAASACQAARDRPRHGRGRADGRQSGSWTHDDASIRASWSKTPSSTAPA